MLILIGKILEKNPQIISKEIQKIQEQNNSIVTENNPNSELNKRNPLYINKLVNLDKELSPLKNHYSPIVRKVAVLLIQGKFSEI